MGGKARDGRRVSFNEACYIIGDIVTHMESAGYPLDSDRFVLRTAGSFRRLKKEMGDIDLIVISSEINPVKIELSHLLEKLSGGDKKLTGLLHGVQIDFVMSDKEGLGAALMHCTGPVELNIRQRAHAKRNGYLLNEKGLWKGSVRLCSSSEEAIYAELGMTWIEPKNRG